MLLIVPFLFVALLLPVFCIGLLMREDVHPTMRALAILILSPYVFIIVQTLRLNL